MAELTLRDKALAAMVVGEAQGALETRRWTLIGLLVLAFTVGAAMLWSALAPLSSAVVASGAVKVDSSRKKIQHLEGGVVKEILVRDGSQVKLGDVLVRLDETRAGAAHGVVTGSRDLALITQARLQSEREERGSIVYPPEIMARSHEPHIAETLRAQESLFAARRSSRAGELSILDQQVAALRSEITGYQGQHATRQEQVDSIDKDLRSLRELDAVGMVEKTRLRAMERDLAKVRGERDEFLTRIASTRTAISEKELKKLQVRKAFQEEVAAELKKVQAESYELTEREGATKLTLAQTELRAPVAGTVTELKVHTAGGVVGPGEVLMEIVPSADKLIIEARVLPTDIDRIAVKQEAGIKLHAFDSRSTPELNGTVSYIAADAVTDPRSDMSYFLVKVEVGAHELARLGEQRVQPGMQADLFIRTGERTFFSYLAQPLTATFKKAWLER